MRWWYRLFPKLWNRIHGGGIIIELLKSFYISSQMLDKGYVYPQKFPGVLHRLATQQLAVFFASFRKLYLDSFAKLRKHKRVLIPPTTMTNIWHFDITVTQVKDLERNCIRNICSWLGAYIQQMVSGTFSGAWDSFNLKMKNSRTEKTSVSVFLGFFRTKQGIRIGESLNRDQPSHSQWNYLLNC